MLIQPIETTHVVIKILQAILNCDKLPIEYNKYGLNIDDHTFKCSLLFAIQQKLVVGIDPVPRTLSTNTTFLPLLNPPALSQRGAKYLKENTTIL